VPLRIKDAVITSIEDAETKRLKILKMSSKEMGANLTLEVPRVLSDPFTVKEGVSIVIDSDEITKGEKSSFYAEGTIFKIDDSENLSVVATFGGLRFVLELSSPKPSQRKIFDSEKIFLTLN
jgi:hypothetical protein